MLAACGHTDPDRDLDDTIPFSTPDPDDVRTDPVLRDRIARLERVGWTAAWDELRVDPELAGVVLPLARAGRRADAVFSRPYGEPILLLLRSIELDFDGVARIRRGALACWSPDDNPLGMYEVDDRWARCLLPAVTSAE